MNLKVNNKEFDQLVQKFLEGGEVPAPTPEEAPVPEQGGSPEELIIQAAAQAVLTLDAQLALQVCLALVQMAGGGAQEAPVAPEGQAPVYRKGGKLAYWTEK